MRYHKRYGQPKLQTAIANRNRKLQSQTAIANRNRKCNCNRNRNHNPNRNRNPNPNRNRNHNPNRNREMKSQTAITIAIAKRQKTGPCETILILPYRCQNAIFIKL